MLTQLGTTKLSCSKHKLDVFILLNYVYVLRHLDYIHGTA